LSDHETDEEPSKDESIEDNTTKIMLRKVEKAEELKTKTSYKASTLQLEEMKRLLAHHEQGLEKRITKCLTEQTRNHDEDQQALAQSQAAATHMFMNHNPSRVISYKAAEHYNNMTKSSDVLLDVNADKWQAFEDHLTKEAANPSIGWSKDILGFQIMGQGPVINLLEKYFDMPPNMIAGLQDEPKDTKEGDLNNLYTKRYRLKALKTKLHNCLTHSFGDHIEESMPMDIINNDGRIYFCLIISHTFMDKDAYKEIINNYILELKITKSNSMESYQRDLLKHLKAYENIKGMGWKKIITTTIAKYRKIKEPAFHTGLNTRILVGPTGHHYHKWLLEMIRWTLESRQDLVSRNQWPKIEVTQDVEIGDIKSTRQVALYKIPKCQTCCKNISK
jgi:hypothetical protein